MHFHIQFQSSRTSYNLYNGKQLWLGTKHMCIIGLHLQLDMALEFICFSHCHNEIFVLMPTYKKLLSAVCLIITDIQAGIYEKVSFQMVTERNYHIYSHISPSSLLEIPHFKQDLRTISTGMCPHHADLTHPMTT